MVLVALVPEDVHVVSSINNSFTAVGLLYWDMKYGCKYADWDEEAHTLDEIKFVLAKFNLANISVPSMWW